MPGIKFKKVKPSQFEELMKAQEIVPATIYLDEEGTVYFLTKEEFDFKNEKETSIEKEEKICYNNNENKGVYPNSKLTIWE